MPEADATPEESQREEFSLAKGTLDIPAQDLEALNWEGMPRVGHLQEDQWRIEGENPEADAVKPYVDPSCRFGQWTCDFPGGFN